MAIRTVLEGILGKLVADEIKAWLPNLSQRLLRRAVMRLPEDQRKKYADEWVTKFHQRPGEISQILYALGRLRMSSKLLNTNQSNASKSTSPNLWQAVTKRVVDSVERFMEFLLSLLGWHGFWFQDLFN